MNTIPIFDIKLTGEEQGVDMISLVDEPAIGVNWIALKDQKVEDVKIEFKADGDKKMLFGPFLIPNKLIYRKDDKIGEYFVRFTKDDIQKIQMKFNSDLNSKNINFQHQEGSKVEAFVSENWIIDGEFDKSKNFGFDLPEGTWFGGVKINDEDFWKSQIKSGDVKGFSVEIKADMELALKKNKINYMEMKFNKYPLADGETIVYCEGDLAVGSKVFIDENMTTPAPDGEHTFADGRKIVVEGGLIKEIMEIEQELGYGKKKDEEMAIDPNTGMDLPKTLTPEDVSMMIDNRFGDLMEEITKLKIKIDEMNGEQMDYKKQIEEKFKMTPAEKSIQETPIKSKFNDRFTEMEARIRQFAKSGSSK